MSEDTEKKVSLADQDVPDLEAIADALDDGLIDITSDEAMDEPEGDAEAEAFIALQQERDEMKDRLVRALAEAENTRKRGERDRRDAEKYGGSRLARDMIPVYDAMKRALDSIPEDQKESSASMIEGIALTMQELLSVFKKHGITPIFPVEGDQFDANLHQAMFEAPVPGTTAGQIIQVMEQGFMIHDRLLRAANVGVSSTPKS
ncbi:MAG: nucleotide exchange factor GrpE [Paracoccaceae bacterium]|jgi:molecular chaperone GrpE|nr:nucleotide exchange factor GrpE [Paracoccaceae bacterium]